MIRGRGSRSEYQSPLTIKFFAIDTNTNDNAFTIPAGTPPGTYTCTREK